ncbi:MAG: methylated-DNA--[protein]-cysteine S-methyltransferase [Polaromonas sp.]|uniref:methylated-DNA--[protein]-cysteine S-methyltransferase n=1 Tax=Polaromonas sp. TaxID=1869339 RepID=UPI0027337D70|nr:methylated-DNA--[protein]-cysteine S-methyltransferase [Polaromonas sp.]MDP2819779.1 methylated-DNA--[protein]-cysteine S-methyltransferase [Polaromonas sp.]
MNAVIPTVFFALFDTAVGACGIAWGNAGICGVQLPETDAAQTCVRMRQRFPEAAEAAPGEDAQAAICGISAMLRGEAQKLDTLVFDMRGVPEFHQRVYAVACAIPPGQTLTYGEVAARLGEPGAARAVGQALGRNPFAPVVPCHRVLAAGDKPGGFSASGGIRTKLRLLIIEGAMRGTPGLFD